MKRSLLVVVVVCGGCGGKAANSPEAAVDKMFEAARNGDASEFRAAFPTREELAAMFDCGGDDLGARYDKIDDDFTNWRSTHATVAAGGFATPAAARLAAGDAVGGCTARRALAVSKADVRLTEGNADKTYTMRFVDLDGTTRVLAF